jgi:hypothetical protein
LFVGGKPRNFQRIDIDCRACFDESVHPLRDLAAGALKAPRPGIFASPRVLVSREWVPTGTRTSLVTVCPQQKYPVTSRAAAYRVLRAVWAELDRAAASPRTPFHLVLN